MKHFVLIYADGKPRQQPGRIVWPAMKEKQITLLTVFVTKHRDEEAVSSGKNCEPIPFCH